MLNSIISVPDHCFIYLTVSAVNNYVYLGQDRKAVKVIQ